MVLTQYEELARVLAFVVFQFSGKISVSKELLDKMPPTRLVWDTTSDPDYIILTTISNEVIEQVIENGSSVS